MSDSPPIRLLCDRCRAADASGEDPFASLGDLLDFAPVPRRKRVGGWTPEAQRAFVAALAVTGSPRQAAAALGRSAFGYLQLRRAEGGEAFARACDRALALAEEKGRHRLESGLAALARSDGPPLTAPAPPEAPPNETESPSMTLTEADRERLRAETLHRALHGTEEPIFYAGRQVGTRRVFNDRLAIHHLTSGEAGGGAAGLAGATILRGREQRIHIMLVENPFITRNYAEKRVKHGDSIVSNYPRPWVYGGQRDLIEELGHFHEAMRRTFAQDPARAAAYETLFGPEGAPEDFLDALRHAAIIFQCFFPGVDRVLGDFRRMVHEVAAQRRAGLLPLATAPQDDEADDEGDDNDEPTDGAEEDRS